MPRGESSPRAGMASDFCYVATGWPGPGLGQWGPGEGGPPVGPRVARTWLGVQQQHQGGETWWGAGSSLGRPMAGPANACGAQSACPLPPTPAIPELLIPWAELTGILMGRHDPPSPTPGFFPARVPRGGVEAAGGQMEELRHFELGTEKTRGSFSTARTGRPGLG